MTDCPWLHVPAAMSIAVGRFTGPVGYRAASGGPIRPTRTEAVDDECKRVHGPAAPELSNATEHPSTTLTGPILGRSEHKEDA